MISVPRNHHMPSDAALRCCSTSAKWCLSSGRSSCSMTRGLSLKRHLFGKWHCLVFICFPSHFRCFIEVKGWRRRCRSPLKPGRPPRVVLCRFAITQRPEEIHHRQQIPDRQNARARSREDIQHLVLRRVLPVTARHSQIAQDELGKERQIKPDEYD